jgi:hypothetical protein
MPRYNLINGVSVQFTAEEEAFRDAEEKAWADGSKDRKLQEVKEIRLEKLIETDYLAMSDNVLSDDIKTFRQSMRDVPQNYTTEAKYDELLARDDNGNLTHSVWSKT